MHPGWWPQRYAPSNGANRSIRAGMREKIRQYEEAGRDPRDMWDEYGNDGCMVKAIKNNPRAKTRLTKATFERVQLPFTITKPGRNRVRRAKRRKRNCSPSYQGDSNENVDARSPSGFTSVDDDAASSQPKLLADSVRRTIARLNGDFMLRSDDISRCTKLLHPADEWHIFDPGYPSENSVLQRLRTRANNLVFFLHAKCHWSLCHLDRKSGQLNHFNSMRHTEMPVSGLVSWLSKHLSIKLTCRITIHEKVCSHFTSIGLSNAPRTVLNKKMHSTVESLHWPSCNHWSMVKEFRRKSMPENFVPFSLCILKVMGRRNARLRYKRRHPQVARHHLS